MKKIFYNIILLIVAISSLSVIFTSCKDDDNLPAATRLFRPVLTDDDIVAGLDADTIPFIKIKWDNYKDANQYIVKVVNVAGTDSATITTDSIGCTFRNLSFSANYNVYIRAVNTTSGLQSRDFVTTTSTPDFPTQLISFTTSNIIDTQVRVLWNTTNSAGIATEYDSLKVYKSSNDSLVQVVAVTSNQLSLGSMILRNLHPSTSYVLKAFYRGNYKGKKPFSTTASENFSGLVFDLRGMSDDDSYKYFSVSSGSTYANTVDSIVQANPNQDITFVLQGGVSYRLPTMVIPATSGKINFVTGLSLNGNAQFAVSGGFNLAANATVGGLTFTKIFFTEAPLEGKSKTAQYYGGTYLFNISNSGSEIQNLSFSNCAIKYKRGICRVQTTAIVDNFTIDNCISDSIANYGIYTADNAGAQIKNVKITNSSFSNCDKLIVNTKPTAYPVTSVELDNNTFVYCGTDKIYWLDFNGCTVTNGIILNNCLFARPGTLTTGALANGIYAARGVTSPTYSNCYMTSDVNWVIGADLITPVSTISGTTLNSDTPGTFKSPTTGDFTLMNTIAIKAGVGDPRWYK